MAEYPLITTPREKTLRELAEEAIPILRHCQQHMALQRKRSLLEDLAVEFERALEREKAPATRAR